MSVVTSFPVLFISFRRRMKLESGLRQAKVKSQWKYQEKWFSSLPVSQRLPESWITATVMKSSLRLPWHTANFTHRQNHSPRRNIIFLSRPHCQKSPCSLVQIYSERQSYLLYKATCNYILPTLLQCSMQLHCLKRPFHMNNMRICIIFRERKNNNINKKHKK